MAFTGSYIPDSFKLALLTAYLSGKTFKLALYDSSATLNAQTTAYTTTGEVVGTGYTAGGKTVAATAALVNGAAVLSFVAPNWTGATFDTRGTMIYDVSSGDAVYIGDFGSNISKSAATLTITMPVADENNGLVVLK
jgi:hypothetical protein